MSARDEATKIIAKAVSGAPFPSSRSIMRAHKAYDALAAAGYRILAPGALDGQTIEACIREINCGCERDHCPSVEFCVKDDVAALRNLGADHG